MTVKRQDRLIVSLVMGAVLMAALLSSQALGQGAVTVDYTYDDNGQLVRAVDSGGNVLTYEYDFAGNLTAVLRAREADLGGPAVGSAPVSINADETVDLRIEGSGLLLAELAIAHPDLRVTRYRANDSHVLLSLEVPLGAGQGLTQLTFTTARGAATYDLTVLGPRPVLFSAFPNRGGSSGGTRVILRGKSLTADTQVSFGTTAVSVSFLDETTLEVEAPPGTPGEAVDLTASNPNGMSVLSGGFAYTFPFSVGGALGVVRGGLPAAFVVELAEPAAERTVVTTVCADPSVAAVQEAVVFEVGQRRRMVPVQGILNGLTEIETSLGPASLRTAVFVSEPYEGPIEVHAGPVGATVLEGAYSTAVGTICLPRRLATAMLPSGQARLYQFPLPAPAPAGGLELTIRSLDPSIATVDEAVTVPEGASTFEFALSGQRSGITRLVVTGDGIEVLIDVFVDVLPVHDGPFVSAPVGLLPVPIGETTAQPAGGYVIPLNNALAPPVGAEVDTP